MSKPIVKIGLVHQVYIRLMNFLKVGDVHEGHKHEYDHMTLLSKGSLKVTIEGEDSVFTAPILIFIDKDKEHTLEALEDDTVASCIHAIRDAEGDIVDPESMPILMRKYSTNLMQTIPTSRPDLIPKTY